MSSTIRFQSFPRTALPPYDVQSIVEVFRRSESLIATKLVDPGAHKKSDDVLRVVAAGLTELGFVVESGKHASKKISRPVFFGESGAATLRYEIDAYHEMWRCGLEVEGTRAIRGGALYRDLIQAMVMVDVDHLCIALPNIVMWGDTGKNRSKCFDEAVRTADALYGHSRMRIPYSLTLIGY